MYCRRSSYKFYGKRKGRKVERERRTEIEERNFEGSCGKSKTTSTVVRETKITIKVSCSGEHYTVERLQEMIKMDTVKT